MILVSVITCPKCVHAATEPMTTDDCQFFYIRKGCGERLKPKPGDCCVVFMNSQTVVTTSET